MAVEHRDDIVRFLNPSGVAIFGRIDKAADPVATIGSYQELYGTERVFFINPAGGEFGDRPVYKSVLDIDEPIDLAVISVGARSTSSVIGQCGEKGIPFALIFTSGFSEVGASGAEMEQQVLAEAQRHGIRVLGPNTNSNAFERIPDEPHLETPKIGLITQSGHTGRPVVQGTFLGARFSRWVPTGNEADLEVADFIEYFAGDESTAVIGGYFEGFKDGRRLRSALTAANVAKKPIVAIKIGETQSGREMAATHTGHMTGSNATIDGLFAQYAVTRVRDLDELLEFSALFAKLPRGFGGERIALYAVSGGSGTLMSEVADSAGLQIPNLAPGTQASLHELLPSYLSVSNPIDNGGLFMSASSEDRLRVLQLIAEDPNIDVIVIGLTGALGRTTDTFASDIISYAPKSPKPLIVTWNSPKTDEDGFRLLTESGLPIFRSFRNCFQALKAYATYSARMNRVRDRPSLSVSIPTTAADVIAAGGVLTSQASRSLLESFDIPLVDEIIATAPEEAVSYASRLKSSVVLKIVSADLTHKSDHGLVALGVNAEKVATSFEELVHRAGAVEPHIRIDGVSVQPFLEDGVEMIVGVIHDEIFGPAISVGAGGVYAEILSDVAVRPLPIDSKDVEEMIEGLKVFQLLKGARGRKPVNVSALVGLVMNVGRLASTLDVALAELDLNPVIVTQDAAVAVDWLVVLNSRRTTIPSQS